MRGHTLKRGRKWSFVIDVGRREDGKRQQRWHSGFNTKREAEEGLTTELAKVNNRSYIDKNKVTVGEFMDSWLARSRRPSTQAMYEMLARCYIVPALRTIRLQELTVMQVDTFYSDLQRNGGRKGMLSPKTIRHVHTTLRAAVNEAVRLGLVPRNVVLQASPPSPASPEMQTWTARELKAFLAAVANDRLYAAFLTAASTGLRRGELLGLRWRDLSLDEASLAVRQSLVVVNYQVITSPPKTTKARRSIALDPDTIDALRAWRTCVLEERIALGLGAPKADDLVFTREDGAPLHPGEFAKRFRRLVKDAGLKTIRFHDLRHTHATIALQAGVHVKVVSERLGHSGVGITLDTYSHAIPAMESEAATRVMELVKSA